MTDMEVDDAENIYICDFSGSKILKYDKQDNFVEAIKIPIKGKTFKLLEENHFAMNLQNGSSANNKKDCFNYICYENDKIITKALPFNKNLQGKSFSYGYGSSSFYTYDSRIFLTSSLMIQFILCRKIAFLPLM